MIKVASYIYIFLKREGGLSYSVFFFSEWMITFIEKWKKMFLFD